MNWPEDGGDTNGGLQYKFKETLTRMSGNSQILDNKPLERQAFQENWFRLARFVEEFDVTRDKLLSLSFNSASSILCKSMALTYHGIEKVEYTHSYPSSAPASTKRRQYNAYPISQLMRVGVMQDKSGSVPQTVQAVDIKGEVLPDILTIAPWEINYAL